MARVLIAADKAGAGRLQRVLTGSKYELTVVRKFIDAVSAASNQGFELIIIGVQFDESQMYELMSALKNNPQLQRTPIMGFSEGSTPMSHANRNICETGMHWLGACDYVDSEGLTDKEIRERIDMCISTSDGVGRKVQNTDETPGEKRESQMARRDTN